jgi:pyruvate dehydrogenase E2 component (dihydrolipoamide acetyltransferase)
VRKLAADLHVDLAAVAPGTGPEGIVTREDVLAAAGKSDDVSDTVGVHGVQATMAQRMALSRSQIPDAHASVQVDCAALLRVRDRLREAAGDDGQQITAFVLTLRLLTIALTHHPMFNSTWVETAGGPHIHVHSAVHLGFGVAAPRGLLVPVVKDCARKDDTGTGRNDRPAHRRVARGHCETGRVAGIDVHGVELRRARA